MVSSFCHFVNQCQLYPYFTHDFNYLGFRFYLEHNYRTIKNTWRVMCEHSIMVSVMVGIKFIL